MVPVSVVIIAKNFSDIIDGCIESVRNISDDIIVIANGNIEDCLPEPRKAFCRVYQKSWDGYGANKNKGIDLARHDWILSIDADEIADDKLITAIHEIDWNNTGVVYDIRFRSYFGKKLIRFGGWGRDHHIRLFHRACIRWTETMVHETLQLPGEIVKKELSGCIHHYSVKDVNEFNLKGTYYAKLSAKKYLYAGRKANIIKLYISPAFGFAKNYIFCLGFLDGRAGWEIARTTFKNTKKKYEFLSDMGAPGHKKQSVKDNLAIEY